MSNKKPSPRLRTAKLKFAAEIAAAQEKADSAKTAAKAAKAAYRQAKKSFKIARRVAKAARKAVKELKCELVVTDARKPTTRKSKPSQNTARKQTRPAPITTAIPAQIS